MSAAATTLPPLDLLSDVPTPALVVDMAKARANHRRAVASLGPGQRLRPHFKAHKCTALARMQLSEGADTICCQTTWEAVVLAGSGIRDIMVTNQVVDRAALDELAEAAKSAAVSALVDAPVQVAMLEETARRAGVRFGVLVEIDVGMKRCGVSVDSDALLELADAIAASDLLTFAGLQSYDGHNAGIADPARRKPAAMEALAKTRHAAERLRAHGVAVPMVAGCATAHLPFIGEMDAWTDIQAGSYLVMDQLYGAFPDLAYPPALFGLATVIHRSPERIVLDIGLKHIGVDNGHPAWVGETAAPLRFSDEHTTIAVAPESDIAVGDRTFLLPRHIDPTINLHPTLWLIDEDGVTPAPVDGRMGARGGA
ncbi:MAG: alanine racemase [Bauldia sp.]|uniref:alanine racemase n=1 Tax=Bauldia sp. TaxID=2575872 RepID=UPI001D2C09E9|nr:alanine racemase [Bauldia sp.]MCB1496262.1 alanine racemase [Bauldia sp.]